MVITSRVQIRQTSHGRQTCSPQKCKKKSQDKLGQNSMLSSFQQTLNQTTKTGPKHARPFEAHKVRSQEQLGGPRNALLCTPEAMFTVSLSESADIHCSTSTVAYNRSGCINVSAA
ncbi:TPA: hypothetical protein ACH3X1_014004 [Trebouxia sp. C0004]